MISKKKWNKTGMVFPPANNIKGVQKYLVVKTDTLGRELLKKLLVERASERSKSFSF
jgi:hypothetical protein